MKNTTATTGTNRTTTLDRRVWDSVVADALATTANSPRWQHAIERAVREIDNRVLVHFDGEAVLILSSSGEVYRSNGNCVRESFGKPDVPCPAFAHNQACWHRATARLLKRYFEVLESNQLQEAA